MRRVFALAFAIAVAGCDCTAEAPGQRGAQCTANSDCDAPLVCRLDLCRLECATTRDCAAGLQCVLDEGGFGACQLPEETRCSLDSDCPDPLVCRNRRCVNVCAEDRDCPPGARCIDEGCVDDAVEACIRDSDCSPVGGEPRVCGTDLRCRRGCYSSRECRLGTECAPDGLCRRRCVTLTDCERIGLGECRPFTDGSSWCDPGSGSTADAGPRPDGGVLDASPEMDSGPGTDAGPMACPPTSTAVSIAMGEDDSCAVLAGGEVWCWGDNFYRELGTTTPTRVNPDPVRVDGITNARHVVAGHSHFCAQLADGRVSCWGHNIARQLGDPAAPMGPSLPVMVMGLVTSGGVGSLSAGSAHTCALDASGQAFCWGSGQSGALGDGMVSIHYAAAPQAVPGLPAGQDWIDAAEHNTFAFDSAALTAWGENNQGELGLGSMTAVSSPASVMFVPSQLDSNYANTCAVDSAGGRLWCWGGDYQGELGDGVVGSPTTQPMPQMVPGIAGVIAVRVGFEYVCIIDGTGMAVRCWGSNFNGQLGNGTTTNLADASLATPVLGLPAARIDELALGTTHACARVRGNVYCWGRNFAGELGVPPDPSSPGSPCPFGCNQTRAARVPCLP